MGFILGATGGHEGYLRNFCRFLLLMEWRMGWQSKMVKEVMDFRRPERDQQLWAGRTRWADVKTFRQ